MNKPQKFHWSPCLDEPIPPATEIESMVNQAYLDNIPAMREQIEKNNRENAQAAEKLKNLIIR